MSFQVTWQVFPYHLNIKFDFFVIYHQLASLQSDQLKILNRWHFVFQFRIQSFLAHFKIDESRFFQSVMQSAQEYKKK